MKIRALALAGATLAGTATLAGPLADGASAGRTETATLTVVKTVEGPVPADAQFVIHVTCNNTTPGTSITIVDAALPQGVGTVYDEDITFGPDGGQQDFIFYQAADCTITETDDGGAAQVINRTSDVAIAQPTTYQTEITNVFVADTTTSSEATTTSAVAAVTATPRFTG